jgi:hypothetical protein
MLLASGNGPQAEQKRILSQYSVRQPIKKSAGGMTMTLLLMTMPSYDCNLVEKEEFSSF